MSYEREIIAALRTIVRSVKDSSEALIAAINNQTQSDIEGRDQPRTITVVHDNEQEAQRDTQHNQNHTLQKWGLRVQVALCVFTALAFGAAAYYASIAKGQKETMNGQLSVMDKTFKEVEKQTRAASEAASAAREANRLTEESLRGRIVMKNARLEKPLVPGGIAGMVIETENIGHSVAFEKSTSSTERWISMPDGPMKLDKPLDDAGPIEPGTPGTTIVRDKTPLTGEFIEVIDRAKRPTIYFFGRVEYESLGHQHFFEFCAKIIRLATPDIPDTPGTRGINTDPQFKLYLCPKWHDSN
jgi:hypothetical protein